MHDNIKVPYPKWSGEYFGQSIYWYQSIFVTQVKLPKVRFEIFISRDRNISKNESVCIDVVKRVPLLFFDGFIECPNSFFRLNPD